MNVHQSEGYQKNRKEESQKILDFLKENNFHYFSQKQDFYDEWKKRELSYLFQFQCLMGGNHLDWFVKLEKEAIEIRSNTKMKYFLSIPQQYLDLKTIELLYDISCTSVYIGIKDAMNAFCFHAEDFVEKKRKGWWTKLKEWIHKILY